MFGLASENDSQRLGQLVENAVWAHVMQNNIVNDCYYARWKECEVDLVVMSPELQKPTSLVEIKWSDRHADQRNAPEIAGLLELAKNHGLDAAVLTRSAIGEWSSGHQRVLYMPASKFCLAFATENIEGLLKKGVHPRIIPSEAGEREGASAAPLA